MKIALTPTELILMKTLWETKKDLSVYEMVEYLKETIGKTYTANTVSTILSSMRKKGAVSRIKKNCYRYHPEISEEEYAQGQLENVCRQWYMGSASHVLASLVEVSGITEEELQRMKEILDEYETSGEITV